PAAATETIIKEARRRFRTHNAARRYVVAELYEALAVHHPDAVSADMVQEQLADSVAVREALLWMWPVLSPAQLVHDLYGSQALIRSASPDMTAEEQAALHRPWADGKNADSVVWTTDDVPILDEAFEVLGPRPKRRLDDDVRTYGHIVVDEAQDLSPMQLRMLTRRSLNGSMTIVGDIAQSTGAWAHGDWDEILEHLPDRKPPRRAELTVGYRIPGPSMDLAARILKVAAPDLRPPISVRSEGDEPKFVPVHAANGSKAPLLDAVVEVASREASDGGAGNLAVIAPRSLYQPIIEAFETAGVTIGRAPRDGLAHQITIVPVNLVKGLEVDVALVVEPSAMWAEEPQPARSLYVACTRATKQLVVIHAEPLPDVLAS
ncbi:MAG: ATP-binding domain-containing protein, partial [Acidimicrobiia bacterium]|nr:ATP-binding domain-containing protein [Acidimicrobiia bacterium]